MFFHSNSNLLRYPIKRLLACHLLLAESQYATAQRVEVRTFYDLIADAVTEPEPAVSVVED